jgi:hypothetical protein
MISKIIITSHCEILYPGVFKTTAEILKLKPKDFFLRNDKDMFIYHNYTTTKNGNLEFDLQAMSLFTINCHGCFETEWLVESEELFTPYLEPVSA